MAKNSVHPATPLARFITERLQALGLKQVDFCRQTGFDQGLLSKLQSSVITTVNLESALRLAEGLKVPPGDVLVHAGDILRHGLLDDVTEFDRWLGTLNHLYRYKVVICGNHDWCFQEKPAEARARLTNALYLRDSGCQIEVLTFYGSPWTPLFHDWGFMKPDAELDEKWALIPPGLDVLITHGPPLGILDTTVRRDSAGS